MLFQREFAAIFTFEVAAAATVFCLVVLALGVAIWLSRRRRRRSRPSSQRAGHTAVELSYLSFLAVVAGVLITVSLSANDRETADPPRADLTVRVIAFQWCWRFRYLGSLVTVSGQCGGGTLPTLVLPSGRPVRIEVTSADVIHSFWVPSLDWKSYAYPGHVNSFTVTLGRDGRWIGRCSEFCGLLHYEMDFYLRAVSPAAFTRWLSSTAHQSALGGSS